MVKNEIIVYLRLQLTVSTRKGFIVELENPQKKGGSNSFLGIVQFVKVRYD